MLIFALDDEALLLDGLMRAIREARPSAEVMGFRRASAVLTAMEEEGRRPDAAFLDIEIPGMNGLELAKRIKTLSPKTNIIFVTGYSHYALAAAEMHTSGYLLKPFTVEKVRSELDDLRYPAAPASERALQVHCFGNFDVFSGGAPVPFTRSKTKELFAYLVDRRGARVDAEELIAVLWEDRPSSVSLHSNFRNIVADLAACLRRVGAEAAFVRDRRTFAVRTDMLDCDYYAYLQGDQRAVNGYFGEYMRQYSWAEMTVAALETEKSEKTEPSGRP